MNTRSARNLITFKLIVLFLVLASISLFDLASKPTVSDAQGLNIGVIFSAQSENFGANVADRKNKNNNIGQVDIKTREQVTFDMLTSEGLAPSKVTDADLRDLSILNTFDVLVFPYTYMMDDTQNLNVRKFVESGGGIVSVFATPRIDTAEQSLALKYGSNGWEYGALSELYQTWFVNDPTLSAGYTMIPTNPSAKHTIVSRTESASGRSLKLIRNQAGGIEQWRALLGNTNVGPILNFSDGKPAAWSGKYAKGRYVYFGVPLMDFWWFSSLSTYNGSQGALAKELLVQSIIWANESDGTSAPVNRSMRTWLSVDAYSTSIYGRQYIKGTGNVQVGGTLERSIVSPSGKTVYSYKYAAIGAMPGEINNNGPYSFSYNQGSNLQSGTWKVITKFTHRHTGAVYQEIAYVTAGQKGVLSKAVAGSTAPSTIVYPTGNAYPIMSAYWIHPNPFYPKGSNPKLKTTSFCYSLSLDSIVSVTVSNSKGVVKNLFTNQLRKAGRHYEGWTGTNNNGNILPPGNYRYVITAQNTYGKTSITGIVSVR